MNPWHNKVIPLFLFSSLSVLTACSGGSDSGNRGDVVPTPPPSGGGSSSSSSSSGGSSGSGSGGPVLYENFGDDLFVNFDDADTIFFFSQDYKALDSNNPQDPWPSFYYPTCCFFEGDDPANQPEVNLEQLGIVSDNGNPSLLLDTGRFTAGQTRPDREAADPKRNTTTSDDVATWGELDLSKNYRISFCVKEAVGSRNMQVYVDNNTSGEANSIWGGGGQGSRIFNVPADQLVRGQRVEINVPGSITFEPGGEVKDIRPVRVGTSTSFLQFRVEGGSTVIIDDLLVEYQDENGQADLPACNVFTPATAPDKPDAPTARAGNEQVTASWSGVVGAVQYDLAYGTSDDVNSATLVEDATSPHTLEELQNDTEYFVFLRVRNSVGWSDWSDASSAIPEAPPVPVGDACAPTTQVSTSVPWGVYDGCLAPHEDNSVVINTSEQTTLDFGSSLKERFNAVTNADGENLGTAVLDTTGVGQANDRSRGELAGIFEPGYPKHFTAIARIKTALVTEPRNRGFEVQIYFADAGKRVNVQLRPDQGVTTAGEISSGGRVQLEKFIDNSDDVKADFDMLDGDFHIYHIAFTMTDADTLNAKVYIDGNDTPVIDETSTGREDGNNDNKLRIGEDSSSAHFAEVDWIIWTTDAATASLKPSELLNELPEGIGELGAYGNGDEEPGETAWTAAALDLAGEGGTAPSGSTLLNEEDKVTITAAGGSVDSNSVRKYFAYREQGGNFTFTARLASVSTTDGSPFATTGNSNRFGIAIMESVTPTVSGDFSEVGRFATVDFYLTDTAPIFQGSRAHKSTAAGSRSRSDINEPFGTNSKLEIGDYLRITVEDDSGDPRVKRFVSDNGIDFVQVNSTKFEGGHPATWFVGLYGAPGDDLTLEFDEITITQD